MTGEPQIGADNPAYESTLDEIRLAGQKLDQWRAYVEKMAPQKKSTKNESRKNSIPLKDHKATPQNIENGTNGTYTANPPTLETQNGGSKSADQNFAWIE